MARTWKMFLLVAVLVSAFPGTDAANDDRLKVVATFSILSDLVRAVGSGNLQRRTLVGPDGDGHMFEPSPADSVALANASLLFENGLGFEPWLEKLFTSSGSKCSTETADPSGAEIAALVERIKAAQMPAIFAENVHTPRLLERIAAAAGVQLAPPLYTDSLGKPGSPGETYLKMMRYNVLTIVKALQR